MQSKSKQSPLELPQQTARTANKLVSTSVDQAQTTANTGKNDVAAISSSFCYKCAQIELSNLVV